MEVYLLWTDRGSIFVGLPVEVYLLACPWKYIRRPARGIIPLAAFYLQVAFKPLAGCEPLAALYIRLHVTPWLHLKLSRDKGAWVRDKELSAE